MIRRLSQLVKWLEVRFPEKVVVTAEAYQSLLSYVAGCEERIKRLEAALQEQSLNHDATLDRVSRVEATAVHKDAVKDLVQVMQVMKEDLAGFKTSLGFRQQVQNEELTTMLNGEFIGGPHNG